MLFTNHALERMKERGASREEVIQTIRQDTRSPAKQGRTAFQHTFDYRREWNGTYYDHKEVTAYAVEEGGEWVVITVICRYY